MANVQIYYQQLRPTRPSQAYCEACKPVLAPNGINGEAVLTDEELAASFGLDEMCPHLSARFHKNVTPAPDASE